MRLFICLLVLGLGLSAVYAGGDDADAEFQTLTVESIGLGDWLEKVQVIADKFVEETQKEDVEEGLSEEEAFGLLEPVIKGFRLQLRACFDDEARKQKFREHAKEKECTTPSMLFGMSELYLSKAENLTLEEVKTIFELVEGGVSYNRRSFYQAYFNRSLILDPDILAYLLKRYKEQDYMTFTGGHYIFGNYLQQPERQWDAQTETVLKLFDGVHLYSGYEYTYSSYFHNVRALNGDVVELDENFTKALFKWITALDNSRKLKLLNWIFAVWDRFNAERFCQFYGWYLETEPPQEDINFIEDAFCRFYGSQRKCYLKKYEEMSKDPRANALLNKAKESYEEYWKKEQERLSRIPFSMAID